MSEFKIEIEQLNFTTVCDKCGKIIPDDVKILTIDTCPGTTGGELVVICSECVAGLKIELWN